MPSVKLQTRASAARVPSTSTGRASPNPALTVPNQIKGRPPPYDRNIVVHWFVERKLPTAHASMALVQVGKDLAVQCS